MPSPIKDRESFIHDRVLQDLIASHLQAMSIIPDSTEVFDLHLGLPDHTGLRTIIYKTMKRKEVELIVHS